MSGITNGSKYPVGAMIDVLRNDAIKTIEDTSALFVKHCYFCQGYIIVVQTTD